MNDEADLDSLTNLVERETKAFTSGMEQRAAETANLLSIAYRHRSTGNIFSAVAIFINTVSFFGFVAGVTALCKWWF